MKLTQLLVDAFGAKSLNHAKHMIKNGEVSINHVVILDPNVHLTHYPDHPLTVENPTHVFDFNSGKLKDPKGYIHCYNNITFIVASEMIKPP